MELQDIIIEHTDKLTKYQFFDLLYKLKNNLEMNANSFSINELYTTLCYMYNDNSPLYQNTIYNTNENLNNEINSIHVIASNISINDEIRKDILLQPNTKSNIDEIIGSYNKTYPINILPKDNFIPTIDSITKEILVLFKFAEENPQLTFYISTFKNDNISTINLSKIFDFLIIPKNIIMPIEFIHKLYIGSYFYDYKSDKYYKINDLRNKVIILDFKNKSILSNSYLNFLEKIDMNNITPITEEVYINNINKLLKEIHN